MRPAGKQENPALNIHLWLPNTAMCTAACRQVFVTLLHVEKASVIAHLWGTHVAVS